MTRKKQWNDYLWIISAVYLILGFFNILFAWLGLICFLVPPAISLIRANKSYCHHYCGRGQLLDLLGNRLGISRHRNMPHFLRTKWFRYAFLAFFLIMFANMVFLTYLVFSGSRNLSEIVTLLWTIRIPWDWAHSASAEIAPWIAHFAFGFYSLMLTSTVLGLITMALYKPRSWCVYCPMGTMTQGICRIRNAADTAA